MARRPCVFVADDNPVFPRPELFRYRDQRQFLADLAQGSLAIGAQACVRLVDLAPPLAAAQFDEDDQADIHADSEDETASQKPLPPIHRCPSASADLPEAYRTQSWHVNPPGAHDGAWQIRTPTPRRSPAITSWSPPRPLAPLRPSAPMSSTRSSASRSRRKSRPR